MKVVVTKVDVTVEADADEIRQALPSILGLDHSDTGSAAPVVRIIEAGNPVSQEKVDARLRPPTNPDQVVPDLVAAIEDVTGVAHVPTGEILQGGPFDSALDIPKAWRWLSDNGMTCHIRKQPGIAVAMCPQSRKKIGVRRLHDVDIPFKATEVCEGCLSALERSRRSS